MIRQVFLCLAAGSLVFLAACVSQPEYQAPPSGVTLGFVQNIAPQRATSRVTTSITVARDDGSGTFVPLGQLGGDRLDSPTRLAAGVPHALVANFTVNFMGGIGHLSDRLVFTPEAGVDYQLVISYLDTGYGIQLRP